MSNAAIGCLSFVARSEPRIRSGRTFFYGVRKLLETICVRVASFFTGYETVREAFSWLPDVVGRSKNV